MKKIATPWRGLLCGLLTLLTAGCAGEQPPAVVTAPERVTPVIGKTTDRNPPPAKTGAKSAPAEKTAPALPYPDRVELFQPPRADPSSPHPVPAARNDDVLLKGFARAGQLRAVLVIDGTVASLAAGETRGGVEVVSIQPPSVILRRGHLRWTQTLD